MVEINQVKVETTANIQGLDEVEITRQAFALLDSEDTLYFSTLVEFANKLMSRFAHSRNPDDLDESISRWKQVHGLAPPGHSFHPMALASLGGALLERFKLRSDDSDLTQAISYFEAAVAACAPEQPYYLGVVANLSSGLRNRFESFGDMKDLDRIIETSSSALSTSATESPYRDNVLNNLANALKERFTERRNRTDLDTALTHYQSCLELRPPNHPSRHSILGNFADAMLLRFEVDGHLQDLESAASYYGSALKLRSPGQSGFLFYLTGLGVVYHHLFNAQGDPEKMEMAIGCYQAAMEYSIVPNLDHVRLLDNYGATLHSRYMLSGNMNDLHEAIQLFTTASKIQPSAYSGRPNTLLNLGNALLSRFNATGNTTDLDSSITHLTGALELCGPGYHQRHVMLSIYGRALSARFRERGEIGDLHLAASVCKDGLALSSPGDVNYASTVANLSDTLLDCFYESGNIDECQIVIDHCNRALTSMGLSGPAFVSLKVICAKAFLEKFRYGRDATDIDTSIDIFREILPTLHEGHSEHVPTLLQLGNALEARFELGADPNDLEQSIAHYRIARRYCKRGDMNYIPLCMNLANTLSEYDHDSSDALDEAIVLLAEVEEILSPTPERPYYRTSLISLSGALFVRFGAQRNKSDIDLAVDHMSRALTLPTSHDEFLIHFDLATFLSARYSQYEDLADLERSVQLFSVATERMPPKHLARGALCRNYGHTLVKLGSHRDRLQHLDAGIALFREALEHLPPSHHDQPLTYTYLAEALHQRARLLRDSDGIHEAINLLRGVMQTLPKDSPRLFEVSHYAAKLSMSMYEISERKVPSFMEDGFRYYEQAAQYTYAHGFMSVYTVFDWVAWAEKLRHPSGLLAYQTSLRFLNQHLLGTASVKGKRAALLDEHWVKRTGTLATDATACAIARGELELALELSEQGRGLLWSQLAQSRTPLDALRSSGATGRALASDFERVSAQLAQSAVGKPELSSAAEEASRLTVEEAARRHGRLLKELNDVVARIRREQGFASFLDRPSFEGLKHAAVDGPVILVNVSRQRCDALIVLHDAPPRLVPLPNATLDELTALSAELYHTLKTTTRVGEEKTRVRQVEVVLRALWNDVVRPIVDALETFLPRGARIWWCPTSTLTSLPLHAAGPYRKGERNLPNRYVSSYTPTLAALVRARQRPSSSSSPSPSPPPAFVAIGQANPANAASPALQTVPAELALVRALVPPSMPFSSLADDASTADAALSALATHAWVHLACHGRPNREQPFDSAFELGDRSVTVLDVVRARSSGRGGSVGSGVVDGDGHGEDDPSTDAGEFAFLSACHTAVSDARTPDEIIHLAAAMQFAGFRSVIGTMWAVDDGMAMAMVEAFYTHMFGGARNIGNGNGEHRDGNGTKEEEWDCTQAARALNRASKSVYDAVSIDQRIVFIHIGA